MWLVTKQWSSRNTRSSGTAASWVPAARCLAAARTRARSIQLGALVQPCTMAIKAAGPAARPTGTLYWAVTLQLLLKQAKYGGLGAFVCFAWYRCSQVGDE